LLDAEGKEGNEGEVSLVLGEKRPASLMLGYLDDARTHERGHGRRLLPHRGRSDARRRGYIHFIGRRDDVFKSSDYRISPFELESVLLEHEKGGRSGRWSRALTPSGSRCRRHS
jgi:acetyl-CoA synthetase